MSSLKLSFSLRWLEATLIVISLYFCLAVFPYANISLPGSGLLGVFILGVLGICFSMILIYVAGNINLEKFRSIPAIWYFFAGMLIRLILYFILKFDPSSDALENLNLAEKLASGRTFSNDAGHLAYLPPGYPLFLSLFVSIFSRGKDAVFFANILLYCTSSFALYKLTKNIGNGRAANLSLLFLAVWPNYFFLSALALKENLTLTCMLIAFASVYKVVNLKLDFTLKTIAISALGGMAFGMMALAQPGLSLLGILVIFGFREKFLSQKKQGSLIILVLLISYFATVTPWMVRNYIVFDGKFSGISTNGGDVFYRANNDLATGLWTPHGTVKSNDLSELEWNSLSWKLGKEWIMEHPKEMIRLSAVKLVSFLKADTYGLYWAVLRVNSKNDQDAFEKLKIST
jgi:Dolichyl-phosphate-mannose-protein mannosyltransferase